MITILRESASHDAMISPGMNSSGPPRFYELGYVKFQALCADLLAQDTRYSDSQVYGSNGQAQKGIDILATLSDGSGIEVGQCKCWEGETSVANIRAASDDFLPHFDTWKQNGLKKFILFAACSTEDTKLQDQILLEIKRFKEQGIVYEFWDARKLHRELRPHPHVVRTHIQNEYWVETICGRSQLSGDALTRSGATSVLQRQGILISELAGEKNKELEQVRELAAEGKGDEALAKIAALQKVNSWQEMPIEVRAKALRIHASLLLNIAADAEAAKQLLAQAKVLCPSANTRPLEAALTRITIGAQAALDLLTPARAIEEWNIRLELLLELGRPDDVIAATDAPPSGWKPTVETAHARSLAFLLNRQVDSARAEIHQALEAKPTHFSLRYVAGMVEYGGTISTAFPAWGHLTWPIPPDWNLIKRDPASVAARRAAAEVFRQLIPLALRDDRNLLRIWELACIANEPERQEEAQKLTQALLSDSPGYAPAIIWASQRGYEFDCAAAINSLRQRLNQNSFEQEEVETLVALLANSGKVAEAEAVLDDSRSHFVAWDGMHSWRSSKAQCLCARGEIDEAFKLTEQVSDDHQRQILTMVILRASIPKTKDIAALANHLQQAYEAAQDAHLLLTCCEAKANAGDWGFVADHAERLVLAVPTEGALRLAVQATFNCEQFSRTRTLLETQGTLCASGTLPADLRRLRAECFRLEGQMPQAVEELERLAQEKPDFANIAQLFQFQQAKGDLPASILTARKFLELPDVPAGFLLQVAPAVRLKDPELAAQLWQQAVSKAGDSPELKAAAALQSYAIGIEAKADTLIKELPALAASGKAPVKSFSIDETIELIRSTNEDAQKISEQYSKGFIPVHLLTGRFNQTLARLILETASENFTADYPRLQRPLFIRHGGRASQEPVTIDPKQKRIYLDITTLLLCQALDQLDLIERAFETVVISGNLATALTSELDKLTHHQPNLLNANIKVLALLDAGKIKSYQSANSTESRTDGVSELMGKEWCDLLEWLRSQGGLLIEHIPLMSHTRPFQQVSLPANDLEVVCGEQQLLHAMAVAGLIPDKPISPANAAIQLVIPILRAEMMVYLESGIAAHFAALGVLGDLAAFCCVFIGADEVTRLRAETDSAIKNDRLRSQIEALLQRISSGQNTGKYRTHLHPSPRTPEADIHETTPEELCLYDLIHFGQFVGEPVCCDDRFLQTFQSTGKSPIIGVTDLLAYFLTREFVSESSYYERLTKIRLANARYLPPTKTEILYHLLKSPIHDGEVQETPSLRTLRRAFAAMLLDRDYLQEVVTNEKGERAMREMELPVFCSRAANDALVELWDSSRPLAEITARADWLWDNLFLDSRLFRQCFKSVQNADTDLNWLGITYALLFTQGVRFAGKRPERISVRRAFFDWLANHAIKPALYGNPQLYKVIAQHFMQTFAFADEAIEETRKRFGDKSSEAIGTRMLVAEVVLDLPDALLAELKLTPDVLERWGLRTQTPLIEAVGLTFQQRDFWSAIARFVKNGEATLNTSDGKKKVRLSRGAGANIVRCGKEGEIEVGILDLFQRKIESRKDFLRSHPRWFDLDVAAREVAISLIASQQQPPERVAFLNKQRNGSLAHFYLRLAGHFHKNKSVELDELMPDSTGMFLQFFRLQESSPLALEPSNSQDSSTRLLASEGLEETICRLSCLPAAWPEAVWARLDQLDEISRDQLLTSIKGRLKSFIQKLHLGRMWVRFAGPTNKYSVQIGELVGEICNFEKGGSEAASLIAILRWVHLRLGWLDEVRKWSADARLRVVWGHASMLQSILLKGGSAIDLAGFFLGHCKEIDIDHAGTVEMLKCDVCHPRNLEIGGLLIRGLAFLFEAAPEDMIVESKVRELLSRTIDQQGKSMAGSPSFWRQIAHQSNKLGSFLGMSRENFLSRLLTEESFQRHFDIDAATNMKIALEQLPQYSNDATHWTLFNFLGGISSLSEQEYQPVISALNKLDLLGELKTNPKLPDLVMVACYNAAAVGDKALVDKLRTQLVELARSAGQLPATKQSEQPNRYDWLLGGAILDAIWKLNVKPSDPQGTVEGFCKDIAAILRAWPALAAECRFSLAGLIVRLPVNCQGAWLPLQQELRAIG